MHPLNHLAVTHAQLAIEPDSTRTIATLTALGQQLAERTASDPAGTAANAAHLLAVLTAATHGTTAYSHAGRLALWHTTQARALTGDDLDEHTHALVDATNDTAAALTRSRGLAFVLAVLSGVEFPRARGSVGVEVS